MKWIVAAAEPGNVAALSSALGISMPAARVLCARGFGGAPQARRFLAPSTADLHDPFLLADMRTAAARLASAIRTKRTDSAVRRLRRGWNQRAGGTEEGAGPGGRDRHLLRAAPDSRRLRHEERSGGRRRGLGREADRQCGTIDMCETRGGSMRGGAGDRRYHRDGSSFARGSSCRRRSRY